MSDDDVQQTSSRSQRPASSAFKDFMGSSWAPASGELPGPDPAAAYAEQRRRRVSEAFAGQRVIVPAGPLKTRSNDTDYRFRPHSAFAHLTGLGVDHEPGAVLVLEPIEDAEHEAVLYFKPMAGRDTEEFYASAKHGEFWIGPRPTLAEFQARLGITARDLDEFTAAAGKDAGTVGIRVLRDADPQVDALIDAARSEHGVDAEQTAQQDSTLTQFLSEMRLVKDDYEAGQLRESAAATISGFEDVVRALPEALEHARGERIVEGTFFARARLEGNDLGYDTIAASGNNATVLHWIRNTGAVNPGELLLLDAGVEVDSLYTADITRTVPVSGTFSPVQRRVYEAVLAAADAAFEVVRPGAKFRDIHTAAVRVLAEHLHEWGLLPVSLEEALSPEGQHHRRWMPHGTSHHLGLDVHDCAAAKRELYLDGELQPGMVFTIEPGLYFKNEDLAVPEEYRGIGVRIEDDVLVTQDGCENLSAALPRTPDAIEGWVRGLRD
ncbi:aminopeptidase P family protein [Nesterenkonia populi]|uniref:aminopeptidase P family protein n=1 Tax=Nesterenkonia populi TaxID=1591087 RepID=UPI0011BEFE5D|nr:aminopeptidase P family protein [Nesterenkonia populi]